MTNLVAMISVGRLSRSSTFARLLLLLLPLLLNACTSDQNKEQQRAREEASAKPILNWYITAQNNIGLNAVGPPLVFDANGEVEASETTEGQETLLALVFELTEPPSNYEARLQFRLHGVNTFPEEATGRVGPPPELNNPGLNPESGSFNDIEVRGPNQTETIGDAGDSRYIFRQNGSAAGYVYFYNDSEKSLDGVIRRIIILRLHADRLWEDPNQPERIFIRVGDENNLRLPDTYGTDDGFWLNIKDTSPTPELWFGIKEGTNWLNNTALNEAAGGFDLGFEVRDLAFTTEPIGAQRLWSSRELVIPCNATGGIAVMDTLSVDDNYDYHSPCPIVIPAYSQSVSVPVLLKDDVLQESVEDAVLSFSPEQNYGLVVDLLNGDGNSISFTISDDDGLATKLRDTSVSLCATYDSSSTDCNSTPEVQNFPSQDAHFTGTKNYTNSGSGCVIDNETNLMWEKKKNPAATPNDVGINSSTFTWFDPFENRNYGLSGIESGASDDSTSNGPVCNLAGASCNTQNYVNWANTTSLCGFSDWRMPKLEELLSLVEYNNSNSSPPVVVNAAIDRLFFEFTEAGIYWTATPVAANVSSAWAVDFTLGKAVLRSRIDSTKPAHVRLVRNNN